MEKKESFFRSIDKDKRYIVANLFYIYFALGVVLIMLGAILPVLKVDYQLDYQVSGMLLSVQSIGFALAGLGSGFLPLYCGLKNSFILLAAGTAVGMGMLLVSGNPIWLLTAMAFIGISKGSISNYNNQIMSEIAEGHAGPLNMLHGFFAIGACVAPFIVLFCSKLDESGWRLATLIATILSAIALVTMVRMKLDNSRAVGEKGEKKKVSYGFLKEKIFWITTLIVFFYQYVEAPMMGLITSFFVDSKVMTNDSAQLVTSALWIAILLGRFSCSGIAKYFRPHQMIFVMTIGQIGFLYMLVNSHSFITMMIATIGLGFSMSGMYGTSVSNAGDLFARYPVCMGFFVLITSMGAVLSPAIIGMIANVAEIRTGFVSLLIAAVVLIGIAVYNASYFKKKA